MDEIAYLTEESNQNAMRFQSLLISLFILCGCLFGSELNAQRLFPGTIYLKDGSSQKQRIKRPQVDSPDLFYKAFSQKGKVSILNKISIDEVDYVVLESDEGPETIVSMTVKMIKKNKVKMLSLWMVPIVEGDVTLYEGSRPLTNSATTDLNGNLVFNQMGSLFYYACKKEQENEATIIATFVTGMKYNKYENNFNKWAAQYFEDSPQLIQDIKRKKYGYEDCEQLVARYNEIKGGS